MADASIPYPPTPSHVPPDLATPTSSYKARVFVVLASLLLFAGLYAGLTAGSAYLCYWSFATMGADTSTRVAGLNLLRDVTQAQEALVRTYNAAIEQVQQEKMDMARFLETLERDLLPPWRAQMQRLTQAQGLPRDEQRLVDQLIQSARLETESWELLARAIRQDDVRLAKLAQQKAQESDQVAQRFGAEAESYYRHHAPRKTDGDGWKFIVGIVAGLLCLFLVKGFFKWRRAETGQRLEVTEKDQPVLFAFIRQLCHDTRAPLPHRVFLTPDVNAAVFYHESLLSLVLPTPKNLVIGLGLVNQLNLSEFKAVLAHEFGHFSQNSMKLGSYVYVSNRVVGDLVYGRDWLDNFVAALRGVDIRIAIFAWGFSGILWVLRQGLQGMFRAINFANSALSRQMEFNADLVAVSVTGSDALVHGLARLDFAMDSLTQAWNDLTTAADHQRYSRDFFYHQTQAGAYLRALRNDPRLGEPPPLPADPAQTVQVFPPQDTSVPRMWATHPTNHDREGNAKRHYIRSPLDERSAWVLFQDAPALRETMTRRLYLAAGRPEDMTLEAPEVVQAFIDEEHAETTYHPRYRGLYDQRYLTPGNLEELTQAAAAFVGAEQLAENHARLYGDELRTRMEAHAGRQQDYQRIAALAHGAVELTGKDFPFRGMRYRAADASRLLEQVKKEIEEDFEWMTRMDREAFLIHHEMARQTDEAVRQELLERYRFHLALQDLHYRLSAHNQHVRTTLGGLAGRRELSQEEFTGILAMLDQAHEALRQTLELAAQLRLPPLKNITPGAPLAPLLFAKPLMPRVKRGSNALDGVWIGEFLEQLGEALDKSQRLLAKNLGGLLSLQERIAARWAAARATPGEGDDGPTVVQIHAVPPAEHGLPATGPQLPREAAVHEPLDAAPLARDNALDLETANKASGPSV